MRQALEAAPSEREGEDWEPYVLGGGSLLPSLPPQFKCPLALREMRQVVAFGYVVS